MHERKAIMSRESCAFVGGLRLREYLKGGLLTFFASSQDFLEASVPSRSAPR